MNTPYVTTTGLGTGCPPYDHYSGLRDDIVATPRVAGFSVERAHQEVGSGGQSEMNYRFAPLLAAADDLMLFKYVVKNTAWTADKAMTCMPKPLFDENGSGMHCHQSLWSGSAPLFYDAAGFGGLSATAGHFIGGILHLIPGYEAPINLVYSERKQPGGQANRVPLPGCLRESLPVVHGPVDGRPRRDTPAD